VVRTTTWRTRPDVRGPEPETPAATSASRIAKAIRLARCEWTGHSETATDLVRAAGEVPHRQAGRPRSKTNAAFCRKRHGIRRCPGASDRRQHARRILPHRAAQEHVERRRLAPQLLGIGDVLPGAAAARPACRQRGVTRLGEASSSATISQSTLRPTGRSRFTRTRSPGIPPGTSSRSSPTLATAAPERSMPESVTGSSPRSTARRARARYARAVHAARLRSIWLA
jgi:hypothetical protein